MWTTQKSRRPKTLFFACMPRNLILICALPILFCLGMVTLKEELKRKRFYEAYGKHVLSIEIVLILAINLIIITLYLFSTSVFGAVAWWITLIGIPVIHIRIFSRIANTELFPYETLRLERFRSNFFRAAIFLVFLWLASLFPLNLFSADIPDEVYSFFSKILGYVLLVAFPTLMIAFILRIGSTTAHTQARLSFKTALRGMELLRKETNTNKKNKLIGKHVKWFKDGLRSYNSYLYESNPTSIEIHEIDHLYRSVCGVALMGKRAERDNIIRQMKSALNCIGEREGEDDLRLFLITLKNINSGKTEKEYTLSELSEMTRILPFSEKLKGWLKSPYVTSLATVIMGIIAIVLQMLRFIWK